MTKYAKQESNSTSLSIAEEVSLGVVDNTVTWYPREPNSYKDFGGQYKLVARNPINASRQQQKGVITDLDAAGGWQEDMTYPNVSRILPGLMFANYRRKAELPVPAVDHTTHEYQPASGGGAYTAGDLLFAKGFSNVANNGLKQVSSATSTTVVVTDTNLASESGSSGVVSKVGHVGAAGDITFTVNGAQAVLGSTALDFTTIGLVPGDWIFIGGDTNTDAFATAANNGFARVFSVTAHALTLDKIANSAAQTDSGAGQSIKLFFGRFIKNEGDPSLIVRRTYNIERSVGKAATDSTQFQREYLNGSLLNEAVFNFNGADKATYELTVLSTTYETYDSTEAPKVGTRAALEAGNAYNTSVDLTRINMHVCGVAQPLFAYLMDFALTIKNNGKTNKALSVLGAFDVTAGQFEVSATATAYFADVQAINSIRNNDSVTVDVALVKANQGMIVDIPLATLGDGRLNVAANSPITLKLDVDAASASVISPTTDYTLSWTLFDYLPNAAEG